MTPTGINITSQWYLMNFWIVSIKKKRFFNSFSMSTEFNENENGDSNEWSKLFWKMTCKQYSKQQLKGLWVILWWMLLASAVTSTSQARSCELIAAAVTQQPTAAVCFCQSTASPSRWTPAPSWDWSVVCLWQWQQYSLCQPQSTSCCFTLSPGQSNNGEAIGDVEDYGDRFYQHQPDCP